MYLEVIKPDYQRLILFILLLHCTEDLTLILDILVVC
jgi:hypothetical protein